VEASAGVLECTRVLPGIRCEFTQRVGKNFAHDRNNIRPRFVVRAEQKTRAVRLAVSNSV
jgi:hypothetical protein